MTGRVFTKLLFSSLLVLAIGMTVLDFTLSGIVSGSLLTETRDSLSGKAALVATHLVRGVLLNQMLPAQAKAGRGSISARSATVAAARNGLNSQSLDPQSFVRSEALAAQADVTLFGAQGRVLATSNLSLPPLLDASTEAVLRHQSPRSLIQKNDSLYLTLAAGGYFLQLRQSLAGIKTTLHLLNRDLLLASILAMLLAMLMAVYLARRAAQRMNRIMAFANRIAAGDLSARMDEADLDEVSSVAHALDRTASRLEQSFHALESKQRELAALLDSMQEAVVAVDASGLVIWSNAVMQRIAPGAARAGRPLVHTIRDPEVLVAVEAALARREIRSGKARSVVPERVFEVNAAPTPDGGAVAVLHDVTEIERSETMRRDFVANVSHELRTPLTSISGYVETLLDTTPDLPDHVQEFLAIILKNAARMNRLTEDLLALANVESGEYKLDRQAIPASDLLEDVVVGLSGMLVDSNFTLEQSETTASIIQVDLDAMTQVFANLIENAMKYGRTGQRVVLGARDCEGCVEFYVQDFGQGIAQEHQARIFERFYRVDKARSRDSGGTGLGLAIARHIVLAHGGGIHVESELGSGCTFIVRLPVGQAQS